MLELVDVSKTFAGAAGPVRALESASLRISAGEFAAVRGPSGCGKSTLLLSAGGLLRPDCGQIRLDGEDVYSLRTEERAKLRAQKIGFVFQRFHLVPYLSVLENVMSPSLAMGLDDAREHAGELIIRFGLMERMDHYPSQLSTGERQRTALARALLNRPKLLLADEPTGNLDPEHGAVVLEALAEFAKEGGAVLLVTHDPRAAQYAGRTILMEKGQLAVAQTAGGGMK